MFPAARHSSFLVAGARRREQEQSRVIDGIGASRRSKMPSIRSVQRPRPAARTPASRRVHRAGQFEAGPTGCRGLAMIRSRTLSSAALQNEAISARASRLRTSRHRHPGRGARSTARLWIPRLREQQADRFGVPAGCQRTPSPAPRPGPPLLIIEQPTASAVPSHLRQQAQDPPGRPGNDTALRRIYAEHHADASRCGARRRPACSDRARTLVHASETAASISDLFPLLPVATRKSCAVSAAYPIIASCRCPPSPSSPVPVCLPARTRRAASPGPALLPAAHNITRRPSLGSPASVEPPPPITPSGPGPYAGVPARDPTYASALVRHRFWHVQSACPGPGDHQLAPATEDTRPYDIAVSTGIRPSGDN